MTRTASAGTPIRGAAVAGAASWQGIVKDKDLTAPPGSPSVGDRYIVASVATGAWTGEEDNIAEWDGDTWLFAVPEGGWVVYVEDEGEIYAWNGSTWGQESFGPHAATHTTGSDQLSSSNAGDILRHSGSVWEAKQFAAQSTAYLVGPSGEAKYTSIQAAIDQAVIDGADNLVPVDINILPGTYTENLSLHAGVSLRSVVRRQQSFGGVPLGGGKFVGSLVKIVGEHVFDTDSPETYEQTLAVDEIWFVTEANGYLFTLSGTGKKRIWVHYSYLDADPGGCFTFSGGLCIVEIDHCSAYHTLTTDVGADQRLISKESLIWKNDRTAAVRLHDGGYLTLMGAFGPGTMGGLVYGSVDVSAGTDSHLKVANIAFFPVSGDAIVVNGQLTADSWFRDITDMSAQKATVSGTYVDQFKEYPLGASAGVSTTDATVTTIATIPIPDNTAVWIEANIINRQTNGANRGKFKRGALVYREAAGAATKEGATWTPLTIKSVLPAQWDVDIVTSGNNALIQVEGLAAQNINWESRHTVEERS